MLGIHTQRSDMATALIMINHRCRAMSITFTPLINPGLFIRLPGI